MNLAESYRLLGLESGASGAEIKAAYRRLARQYHPDANPGDRQAQEKFIEITQAYKFLLSLVESPSSAPKPPPPDYSTASAAPPKTRITRQEDPSPEPVPPLSLFEEELKWTSYRQLQDLLKKRRFARAIALVEGLAQRLPTDPEVRQWQAIAYQQWGRQLIAERQLEKARIYLKKALKTDPHNRSLWAEVERDFRRLEQIY